MARAISTSQRLSVVIGVCLASFGAHLPAYGATQDQIQWVGNFQQAAATAKAERKLVLLHFYSDDCPPCVRVERNVFSQESVAQAVGSNYVAMKVHVKESPQLATRYQVKSWPTDIFVNPAGQEIFRTTSPQSPLEYVSLVNHVAMQAGVGAARTAQAQSLLQLDTSEARTITGETAETPLPPQQAPPRSARSSYQPQSFADTSGMQQTFGQFPQQSDPQQSDPMAAVPQQQGPAPSQEAMLNRYAVGPGFAPVTVGLAPPQTPTAAATITSNFPTNDVPAPSAPAGSIPVPIAAAAVAPAVTLPAAQTLPQPDVASAPFVNPQPPSGQLVPASQAPPLGLDGYCPVTILEQTAWRKGDSQFGAIHRGRTYLFASASEQTKFLADPDRYSPVLSGYDPVRFAASGKLVDGTRKLGVTFRNQLFLFADEASRHRFEQNPLEFATTAHQAMLRSETQTKYR